MKKLAMVISLFMVFSMMFAPTVMADTISKGDYVELTAYNGLNGGGIMTYAVSHASNDWSNNVAFSYDTFCIQDNVYITPGVWYPVASVSNNVGYFAPKAPPNGAGPLNGAVDYLFYRYKIGAYNMSTLANQADFQDLLWTLQESGGPFTTDTTAAWYADLTAWIGDPTLQHPWGTQVINIASGYNASNGTFTGPDIQNQLYNAVPEPTTMLLLGLGLIGLAGVRRKFTN